jgi:hypothetical protein
MILEITIKSGIRHFTISIIKNDLVLRNIVFDSNRPNIKTIKPLNTMKAIKPIQPHCTPKIALLTKLNTMALALQIAIGVINIDINLSFLELEFLANIIAGTVQPKPVNKVTTLLPLIPNFSNISSSNTETRDNTPTCCIKLTHKNKMINTGTKVKTVKNPVSNPSVNIWANQ